MFDNTTAQSYADTIQDLEANQAALLLSTQGLTDAQIAETLAAKEDNVAKNYQAMEEAGLLKSKQSLTQAQVQQNLQAVLGEEADTSAAMAAMGLSAAIEGEEHQVVQITAQKLREAVTTGELTEAQAQELAMRTGITVSMNEQAVSGLPRWIASMKAATAAVWLQVKAQAAMMAANPMTWIMGIVAVIGVVKTAFNKYKQSLEETRQKAVEVANAHKEAMETLASHKKTVGELSVAYNKLSKGVDTDTNQNLSLSDEDYQSYLDTINKLADLFPSLQTGLDENGNSILSLGKNGRTASEDLKELLKAEEDLNNYKVSQDIALLFTNVKESSDEAAKATAKYEEVSSSIEKAKQSLKNLSEDGVDLSNSVTLSGSISDEAGIAYYNAIIKSIQNFKNKLSIDRQIELSDTLDPSSITDVDEKGAFDIYLNTFLLSEEERSQLQNEIKVQATAMMLDVDNALEKSFQEQKMANQKAEFAWKDYIPSIVATMKASGSFKGLANGAFGEDLQNFAIDLVSGLDQSISQEIDKNKPDEWIMDNIITPLTMLDENGRKEIIDAYHRLMDLNPDDLAESNQGNIDKWIRIIAEKLGRTETDIRLNLGFKVDEDLQAKYDTSIENAVSKFGNSKEEMQGLFTELEIDTTAEIDRWNEIAVYADNAAEAKKRYLEASVEHSVPAFNIESFSEALESLSELQSAYNDFYNDINKDKVDFTFEISDIEKLREDFGGVCQSFDEFEKLATSSSTTAEQMQKAFDQLAAEFIINKGMVNGLNTSTRDMIVSQMELKGIANASSIITEEVANVTGLAAEQNMALANAADDAFLSILSESNASETTRMSIYALALAEIAYNNTGLDTSGKIAQLAALATAYGDTASAAIAASAASYAESMSAFHGGNYSEALETKYQELLNSMGKFSNVSLKIGQSSDSAAKSADKGSKSAEKEVDILSELISEMDKYKSKLKAVEEARETYNEYGKITADQAKDIVDADFKLLAAYGDEQAALEDLGKAKLNEMQIQLARNAIDTINKIQSEAEATRYLAGANEHLVGTSLDATEAMLQQAVAAARLRGELQGQAADTILKGYQNGAMLLGKVDFGFDLSETENAKKDAEKESDKQFEKQFNWIDRLLDKFSRITEKWKSTADQFTSWWNKNWSLDKAIRSNRSEIEANVDAYNYYNKKAKDVGLSKKYRDLVDTGKISMQDIHDEELADKIDKYIQWKDQMRDCIDTIEELYNAERDMIRQKFDNMVEYYNTLDSKVQSVVSRINSLFDLNETRGKRTDINDLLEKFNGYSDLTDTTAATTTTASSGAEIKQHLLSDEEAAKIHKELDHQKNSIYDTATYKKLLDDIAKLEAEKAKKGDKFSKSKEKKLQDYYKKQKALEKNATADTVTSYAKVYDAYLKLQNKLDAGKSLTKAQRVKYNDYVKQLEEYASARSTAVAELTNKLEDNVETSSVEAIEKAYEDQKKEVEDSYNRQIEDVKGDVQGTQQYKNLIAQKDNLEKTIADLTAKKEAGTIKKSESQKLEKYLAQLDALNKKIAAIDEGATSENISDYIKAYDRLVKLQSKKKLTAKESAEYDNLMAQLKAWNDTKQDILESLNRQLLDAIKELDTAQSESVNETTADIAANQEEAYEIAKQIAELQVSTLEDELALIDSALSKIEKRLDLYKKFGADALKDMGYLDADDTSTQDDLYASTFASLIKQQTERRDNLLHQKDIYEKLIDAVASHDYDQISEMYKDGVFEQYGDTFQKVVEMLNNNTFDGFSATWVDEWTQSLDTVESDLYDLDMTLQDLKDQFREEVTFRAINDAIEKLGYLKEVVKDASSLIDDELLYDADGSFSSFGTAKVSTLVEQLELAQQLAYEYAKKIAVAQADTTYASEQDKDAAIRELEQSYRQQLLEAKGYSDSIVSLYKNQAKQEVDILKDIIAKRKEALQSKKDYYDYDKSLKSKTKDIEAIQAQIAALSDIDSAEARARKAQLESDLADLNDELDEMKKEHAYTLQIHALDDFSDQLSETLENAAKDAVDILSEQKGIIDSATKLYQQSNDVIQDTIDALVRFYGENGIDLGNTTSIASNTEKPSNMDVSSIGLGDGIRELKPGEALGLSEEAYEQFKSLMPFNVCDNQSYIMFNDMQNLMHANNEMVQSAVNAMLNKDVAPVAIQNHYDCLLRVDGNIDKEFSKLLPSQLEQSFQYNIAKMASEMQKLGWQRVYR